MSYDIMKQHLLNIFTVNNFEGFWLQGEVLKAHNIQRKNPNINQLHYNIPNLYNLNLTIDFPGYKTNNRYDKLTYDYRVDLNNTTISHANIIVDIYNKAQQMLPDSQDLYNLLIDLAANGDVYNRDAYLLLDDYNFNPPQNALLNYVQNIHNNLGKYYQRSGNAWNYTLDQLSHLIMWIVLQEDINYPMTQLRKNGQPCAGRRMSFYRYLEAVYCAQNPNDVSHTLAEVIERALQHNEPPLWNQCNINYQSIINLIQKL